ncbi:hypothetical protein Unana1_02410 [Umbelopsis nana]
MPWVHYSPFKKQKQQKKDKKHQESSAEALIHTLDKYVPTLSVWEAIHAGDIQAVNYHLANADNVHAVINLIDADFGYNLLHAAIIEHPNSLDLQRILLYYGAEVDIYSGYNVQPIHTIPLYCNDPLEHMILLLNYGANVNAVDGDCWTPLHYVARFTKQPLETMRMLVKHGAKLNSQDTNSKTPAFCLLANGDYVKELEWMIDAGTSAYTTGLILDASTGIAKPGSLLVQAAKYSRPACLTWLLARYKWSQSEISHASKVAESQLQHPDSMKTHTNKRIDKAAQAILQVLTSHQHDRDAAQDLIENSLISRKISLKLLTRF